MKRRTRHVALWFGLLLLAVGFAVFGGEPGFTVSDYNPAVGATVQFSVSYPTSGAQYAWDFDGNGTYEMTTTQPTLEHAFTTPGVVQVSLRVTDVGGRVTAWRRGLLVGESSLYAVRAVSKAADGTILVDVTLYARSEIRAPGLEERIPQGWQIEIVNAGNAVTKRVGNDLQVLSLNPIAAGDTWTFTYRLHPPYGAGSPTFSGTVSGYGDKRVTATVCGDTIVPN